VGSTSSIAFHPNLNLAAVLGVDQLKGRVTIVNTKSFVTKDNLASPEIQALVHPDLETWLGK